MKKGVLTLYLFVCQVLFTFHLLLPLPTPFLITSPVVSKESLVRTLVEFSSRHIFLLIYIFLVNFIVCFLTYIFNLPVVYFSNLCISVLYTLNKLVSFFFTNIFLSIYLSSSLTRKAYIDVSQYFQTTDNCDTLHAPHL